MEHHMHTQQYSRIAAWPGLVVLTLTWIYIEEQLEEKRNKLDANGEIANKNQKTWWRWTSSFYFLFPPSLEWTDSSV
jgi:hypothetical protein